MSTEETLRYQFIVLKVPHHNNVGMLVTDGIWRETPAFELHGLALFSAATLP